MRAQHRQVRPPRGWDCSPPARWVESNHPAGGISATPVLLFLPWAGRQSTQAHNQEHAGVKYNCLQCDKSFSREDNLKTHSIIYTGEKPHNIAKQLSCDACLKTFARRSHLLRHERAHGGVKYNCTLCNKSFSQNTSLKTTPAYILGRHLTTAYSAANHLVRN